MSKNTKESLRTKDLGRYGYGKLWSQVLEYGKLRSTVGKWSRVVRVYWKEWSTCGGEEGGDGGGGGENQLKLWGIGSTWRQLPTMKLIIFHKKAFQLVENFLRSTFNMIEYIHPKG